MPANYVLLERVTLTTAAASVALDSIPQTGYTDLVIKVSARNTAASSLVYYTFNGNASNRTARLLYGDGTSAASVTYNNSDPRVMIMPESGYTANSFSNGELYIPNYTSSTVKSWSANSVQETNAALSYQFLMAGLWSDTAAINSVTFSTFTGNFAVGSSFSLYGVAALGTDPVIAPKASGGDIVVSDGTYWYHTFLNSSVFTPNQTLTCDYLVVAGGGAGGGSAGGGGGAGGLRSTVTATGGGGSLESPLSVIAQNYAVLIGAGGAGVSAAKGRNGNNSVFASITSLGGGGAGTGAGGSSFYGGITGGSGGGAGGLGVNGTGTGGSGTANQGFKGGDQAGGNAGPGGGGGSSAAGQNGNPSGTAWANGDGGNGTAISITGSSVTYAGGGGGGSYGNPPVRQGLGGTGGAGNGGATVDANGFSATANTGSGGGGGVAYFTDNAVGGNGGSGIVIVRYTVA
jgi:hypothetical protein